MMEAYMASGGQKIYSPVDLMDQLPTQPLNKIGLSLLLAETACEIRYVK